MTRITFQGAMGAYSHIACTELFPNAEYIPSDTFEQAMELVDEKQADFAVIPVENSNAGRVSDVHFLLPKTDLTIIGEHFLRVEHQLLALPEAKLENIKTAQSHPQALAQCSKYLKQHNIKQISRIDTAKSCEQIIATKDLTTAAIASKLAAEIYHMQILAANIENDSNNTTRFLIMSKDKTLIEDDGTDFITSLVFKVKNIPAALYKALGGFATNNINLTKIESYMATGNFASTQFYVEIESHPSRKEFRLALEELKFYSENIHFLGTYKASPKRSL
ncbi:MAG: prephenate dehydratase [Alphaproteobacteria bacterium]|nr:prephenate dehydratase [Alphaproteobacteria bacterium]